MATRTITENVNQAVQDFDNIKQAIIDKGIEVPNGTPTSEYADKIGTIKSNGLDTSTVTDFSNFAKNNRFTEEQLKKIDTSIGTDFGYMFDGCTSLTTITIPQLYTSKGTNFGFMFRGCSKLTTVPQLDTSNGTSFSGMVSYCSSLTTIPQLDTSIGTKFDYMFGDCRSLTTIPQLDTSNGTNFYGMFSGCTSLTTVELTSFVASQNMFSGCSALENLTVTGTITVNNNYLNLSYSPKLTVDSLMSVINALSDNTGKTTYTVTLGATNLAKLTDEQKQIAIDKNYTLA